MSSLASKIARGLNTFPDWAVVYMPGPLGRRARHLYWKSRMRFLGRNVTFGVGVQITNPAYISIGDNTWIDDYVILLAGPPGGEGRTIVRRPNAAFAGQEGEIRIGRNCHIAQHVTLQGHGGLSIGDDSGVASGARIYSLSHHYRGPEDATRVYKFTPRAPAEEQLLIASPTVMDDWTAVGLNSVLLPGATVGKGTWVATLSMVMGPLPPHCIASGIPAKVVKEIRASSPAS